LFFFFKDKFTLEPGNNNSRFQFYFQNKPWSILNWFTCKQEKRIPRTRF
jgi:hypothetical protein